MKFISGLILMFSLVFQFHYLMANNEVDSLKRIAANQPPAEKMKTYNKIADLLLNSNPSESHQYTRKSLTIALELKNEKGLEDAYINLGWYYLQTAKNDSARYILLKAIERGKANNSDHSLLNAMTGLSNALSELMMYDSAITVLNDALRLAERKKAVSHLANIYAVLGNVYSTIGLPDTAVALYFEAKKYYEQDANQNDLAVMLNNIAIIFIKSGKYAEALEMLDEAIEINTANNNVAALMMNISNAAICYRETGYPEKAKTALVKNIDLAKENKLNQQLAINYNTLGNTLISMGEFEQGRKFLDSSLMVSKVEGIGYGIMVNHIDLGFMFQQTGQADSALLYFQKSLSSVRQYNLKNEELKILKGMYKCFKSLGSFDSALYYHEAYKTLSDTLRKIDVNQKLTELEGKYRQEKNLKTIAELNENIFRQRADHRLILVLIIIAFSAVVFYFVYKRYKNHNRLLQTRVLEKEKERLETEFQAQQKELAIKAMHMARLNELSFDVSQKLKELSGMVSSAAKEKINALISNMELSAPENAWKEFETRFENVHQDFYHALRELHPELTPTEIKICSLIRLSMTSKDISILTNRSIRTVESTRSSIRKKLNLGSDTSLSGYLLSF